MSTKAAAIAVGAIRSRGLNHRQTWPLSRDAHKSSGTCSVCHAVRQIHTKDGTVHQHGPRNNRCLGSDKPPLSIQFSYAPPSKVSTHTSAMPVTSSLSSQSSTVIASSMSTTSTPKPVFTHPSPSGGLIKHIPKSARPACATLLSSLLRNITTHPEDNGACMAMFTALWWIYSL